MEAATASCCLSPFPRGRSWDVGQAQHPSGLIESLKLEQTCRIFKSKHQLTPTTTTSLSATVLEHLQGWRPHHPLGSPCQYLATLSEKKCFLTPNLNLLAQLKAITSGPIAVTWVTLAARKEARNTEIRSPSPTPGPPTPQRGRTAPDRLRQALTALPGMVTPPQRRAHGPPVPSGHLQPSPPSSCQLPGRGTPPRPPHGPGRRRNDPQARAARGRKLQATPRKLLAVPRKLLANHRKLPANHRKLRIAPRKRKGVPGKMAAAGGTAAAPVCVLVLGMAGSGKTTFVQVRCGGGRCRAPPRRVGPDVILCPLSASRPTCTASAAPRT